MRLKVTGFLTPLLALVLAWPATAAQVVINEILPNPGSEFDGAEFIELYNTTGAAVDLTGWVLTGTEFSGTCGGEDHWQFPTGASIPANGYIIVAKDNIDTVPGDENDGFLQRFGFDPDFEMVDLSFGHDTDDPFVDDLTLLTPSGFNDQIGLIPGDGFARSCVGFNQYEALYLYDGVPGGGGVVIDVIEYRDPTFCTSDACLGVGTGDNDAYAGLPGVGESLGRDALSTDTDDSSADLILGTPTPGAANIANIGPTLSGLTVDNPDPLSGEPTNVTILATDPDGVAAMWLVFTVNGGAADSTAMTLSGVDQYTGTIPGQLDNDLVEYFVRATDGGNAAGVGVSKFPDFASRSIRWGTQTIFSVQFHSPPSDGGSSNEVGNAVNIEGIVTAEDGLYSAGAFVIQAAPGFWNGVHCFDNNSETQVQRGDSVRVSGVVQEFFGLTEVAFFGSANVQVLSNGNALPGPDLVTPADLTTGNPIGEAYEGVHVRLENVGVANDSLGFGEWLISDGGGSCRVDDDAFYNYNPTTGDSLDAIEGIVAYSFSNRKLEPRDDGDIIGPPIVSTVRYSPICPGATDAITFSAQIVDNGTIARAKLYFSLDNGATYDSTDMADMGGNNWEATLGPYPDGSEVDYHIEVTDDMAFNGRAPSVGNYDLYVGMVAIETIQSTFLSGTTDSSLFEGSPRNVAGIVTMAPGAVADNIFTIQNHWVTDPAFRGIQVFTGGSVVGQIQLGDSVCVSGDVDEFFGKTQIRLHFTEAFVNLGFVGELPAFDLATTDLPPDSLGAVPAGEAWESVLVQMSNSIVTNSSAGFGQYFIDNTVPENAEETLVDDEARFGGLTYAPSLGDSITVRGTVDFSFGEYKIQPRNDSDILPFNPADAVGVGVGAGADLSFALHQNAPNPVQGASTRITFALPRAGSATLRVYDVTGRLVRTLVDGKMDAGVHVAEWNGRNDSDRSVATGVYFYRLQADGKEATRKMILLR